ncbi:response regulator transcription factor [Amycolatopsis keratiniphila]|uniref:response regulator transcription factor n=1 Tax=Amycolatopsis keratiniphila TaxID=129921 RepID=UPI00087CC5ED|nr:response regulator transcription factor [Amycolatopsis keratiniphila]OLZ61893.1 DNA-binding response regulator [Amycolatopsis keratiniphila subsp. nogabecina]SDU15676.1 DNA-binding response regulator, NarL/FixJ family, contains REC and HTH domains [Amycolatopsis keratiniphila]
MIKVLVVDDDPLVRGGLRLMLGGATDVEVVGEAADGAEVSDAVSRLCPDVVLMDVRMPVLDGITATAAVGKRTGGPAPAVVMLTTFDADETVLAALRAGAAGFLLKHTPPEQIVDAVRRAAAGEPVLSPDVARTVIAMAARQGPDPGAAKTRMDLLTERERQVADAVAEGLNNAEIAERLHLSRSSIKATISSALTRLGLTNRIQLAIVAHEAGRT